MRSVCIDPYFKIVERSGYEELMWIIHLYENLPKREFATCNLCDIFKLFKR